MYDFFYSIVYHCCVFFVFIEQSTGGILGFDVLIF